MIQSTKEMNHKLKNYISANVLAMVGMSCYILADTFFISLAQGADGITALNLALPVYNMMFAIGAMIGIGSATRFAIGRAAGVKDADAYFSNALFWILLSSLLFVVAGITSPDHLLRLFGADERIVFVGTGYMRIALCFAPFFMTNYLCTSFVRNDGAPKTAMCATLVSSLFNIVFDYILMFPLGLGMVGAALATAVSPIVSISICMTHFLSKKSHIHFLWQMPSIKRLLKSIRLGIAAFVGEFASGVTTMVFNYLLLSLVGNVAVAAYGVVANLALVGVAIFNGISQGIQPIASDARGRRQKDEMRYIIRYALRVGIIFAAFLYVILFIFTEQFVAIFNSEASEQLAQYAIVGLRIYFVGFLFASTNLIGTGYLSAVGRGKESALIAIARGVVAIVFFAFVLSRIWGVTGVWMAFPVTEAVCMVATLLVIARLQKE